MGRRRTATLDALLAYKNEEVVARFCKQWSTSRAEGRRIFTDLMRFLWLTGSTNEHLSPVWVVDEMWHMFLVYTRDYARFCSRYFGHMIHHGPTTLAERRAWREQARRSLPRARAKATKDLTRQVGLVLDHLGERVMLRWYVAYAAKYDARFFRRAFRPGDDGGATPKFSPDLKRRARLTG